LVLETADILWRIGAFVIAEKKKNSFPGVAYLIIRSQSCDLTREAQPRRFFSAS
jgi:hypothetical protein